MTSLGSSPQAAVIDPMGGDWAICCSGGGIRSAACCLGALQSLDQGGLLETAKWIVGVSGGSYIASSRALVAHDLPPGTVPHAYTPGTAEERNFRDNTRYIARALGFGVRPPLTCPFPAGHGSLPVSAQLGNASGR